MNLQYKSTRSDSDAITASKAILKGLADDGGLYVPTAIPKLEVSIEELSNMTYQEVAYEVMKLYFTDFTESELKDCINKAYDDKFDTKEIAPLVKVGEDYYLELFHGATIAFKDMALSILPYLMTTAAKKNNVSNEIVILTATSGDTGKAALAGFADVEGTKIIVFYPKDGVSSIQEKQMITQKGKNTFVVSVKGNFDDTQSGVKEIFNDRELEKIMNNIGYQFSSANSINIGRLFPQVAYYVYAYSRLYKNKDIVKDEKINVAVPTGNFGNILAAYYAKQMGLPINKFICASNDNKVLFDFLATGTYDKNREFVLTSSPSMDILISSNLERLIYKMAGDDPAITSKYMEALVKEGKYTITEDMKNKLNDFYGGFATENEVSEIIKSIYEASNYVMDTHTAVAVNVYNKYKKETEDNKKTIIVSTASPYKFTGSVMTSINSEYKKMNDFEQIDELSRICDIPVPKAVEELRNAPIMHDIMCEKSGMKSILKKILKF